MRIGVDFSGWGNLDGTKIIYKSEGQYDIDINVRNTNDGSLKQIRHFQGNPAVSI